MNRTNLAIVIPYYKLTYFGELLAALAKQTNRNFNVYVGDDCSPSDPTHLIDTYSDTLQIFYHRFSERLGHISLTRQWDRCIGRIQNEEWVWVLPDDDLPSENAVEAFYHALENGMPNINIFRLSLNFIDKAGTIIRKASNNPFYENNYEFYSRLVRGKTEASLGDNIFRRQALQLTGGFVEFPTAWGSDHATILNVSSGALICHLPNAFLGFRMSGENISSNTADGHVKMSARVAFANWIKTNEHLFPQNPDKDFYKFFYWKGEYYATHHFSFNIALWRELYRLRNICMPTSSPLPLLKLLLLQLLPGHYIRRHH